MEAVQPGPARQVPPIPALTRAEAARGQWEAPEGWKRGLLSHV